MDLEFLQDDVLCAIRNLNFKFLSEIRLRKGQPVILEYRGEYKYLCNSGTTDSASRAVRCEDPSATLYRAMGGNVFSFAEQLKDGFITVSGGVRIGIAGEYVTENGCIKTVKNATSLNIRIPHNAAGCSSDIYNALLNDGLHSILLFSAPGYGKTTMLRDLVIKVSKNHKINMLVLDVRNEISGGADEYDLGETVDVVLSCDKLISIKNAIRAMKPQLIVTDELYGEHDLQAMEYAADCGIYAFASTHVCNRNILRRMPFEYFVCLTGINEKPLIYDKNFNIVCDSGADGVCRRASVGGKEEKNGNLQRIV